MSKLTTRCCAAPRCPRPPAPPRRRAAATGSGRRRGRAAELEDAAGADRARADHVAGPQHASIADAWAISVAPAWCRSAELAPAPLLAVDPRHHRARGHARRASSSSSGVTSTGPSDVAKSLPLAGPRPRRHLPALEVAGRPVVHHREAGDHVEPVGRRRRRGTRRRSPPPPRARSRAPRCPAGARTASPGPSTRGRVREVEDGQLVPVGLHLQAAAAAGRGHVGLEGVEVADRRRLRHGASSRTRSSGLRLADRRRRVGRAIAAATAASCAAADRRRGERGDQRPR